MRHRRCSPDQLHQEHVVARTPVHDAAVPADLIVGSLAEA